MAGSVILDIAFTVGEAVFVFFFAVSMAVDAHRPLSNLEKTFGTIAFFCAIFGPVIRHHLP